MNIRLRNWDYLIVGQGIAGTLLTHFLSKAGCRVLVVDQPHRAASSLKAAGVINPITGRRFAKSWMIEQLLPFAEQTYRTLEKELNIKIWTSRNLLRVLPTAQDENEWLRRSAFPDFKPWIAEKADLAGLEEVFRPVYAWGETVGAGQADFPVLLRAFRMKLLEEKALIEETFDFGKLVIDKGPPIYDGIKVGGVIFCEGARAVNNPFFNYLPFAPTKGEYLIVRIPGVTLQKIVKHGVTIVPSAEDRYWVGATSRFEFDDEHPSVEQKNWLLTKLQKALALPFEVEAHNAAIRPTVFDIRPFLGTHPTFKHLHLFNGLGTKGASLGPFFAAHFTSYLTEGTSLMPEVDITRFEGRYMGKIVSLR